MENNESQKDISHSFFLNHIFALTIVLSVVIIGVVWGIVALANTPSSIYLTDFVKISFFDSSDNGGEVYVSFDDSDLYRFWGDRVQFNEDCEKEGEEYLSANGYTSPLDILCNYIYIENEDSDKIYGCSFTPEGHLSNGDEVLFQWTFFGKENEVIELFDHLNVELEYSEQLITVSGLSD